MVVVDGYGSDPIGRKFHINMGWGGLDDNYYFLDEAVETSSYTFEPSLDITYNIKPCSGLDCVYPEPPAMDLPPKFYTQFKNIIINADEIMTMRLDARDENGDDIQFSTILSNSETIITQITYDTMTIKPLPGCLNQASALRISAEAGGPR
jgi:hypothetical protein